MLFNSATSDSVLTVIFLNKGDILFSINISSPVFVYKGSDHFHVRSSVLPYMLPPKPSVVTYSTVILAPLLGIVSKSLFPK